MQAESAKSDAINPIVITKFDIFPLNCYQSINSAKERVKNYHLKILFYSHRNLFHKQRLDVEKRQMKISRPAMRKELIERIFKFETLKHRCAEEQISINLYQKISLIVARKIKVMSLDDRRFVDAIAIYHIITSKEIDTKDAWRLYKKIKNQLNEYQRLIVLSHFAQRNDYRLTHKKAIKEEFYSINLDRLKNSGSNIKKLFVHSKAKSIENFISQA